MDDARARIEQAARASYGRLVAYLAARSHDIAAAEDALSESLVAALARWPEDGVPANPEAWLMAAAKRKLIDGHRRATVRADAAPTLVLSAEAAAMQADFPDERLKLMFICAHPAIDPAARTPLMLQTVLGLDAARIGSAFLVAPEAMRKRLVRTKAKIKLAGVPFETPSAAELPARLEAVLEAIYAAFGAGGEDASSGATSAAGLVNEALWLARLLTKLAPAEPEAHGLLALMLHVEARRTAGRDTAGAFVPLAEQNPANWSRDLTAEAETALARASALTRNAGRFHLEAIVQSLHAMRAAAGSTPWTAIADLYGLIMRRTPTWGAMVAHAVAVGEAYGAEAGLRLLDPLSTNDTKSYQPFWAARAHLLAQSGDMAAAREAYGRAAGLSQDAAVRAFLLKRQAEL